VSRYYIGYTSRGPTVLRNIRKDDTGEPLILVDEDEVKTITLDLTNLLETGETISSATVDETQNVTATRTLSSPTITVNLSSVTSYTDGYAVILITLSSGEVIRQLLRVRRPARYGTEQYVRDYT